MKINEWWNRKGNEKETFKIFRKKKKIIEAVNRLTANKIEIAANN